MGPIPRSGAWMGLFPAATAPALPGRGLHRLRLTLVARPSRGRSGCRWAARRTGSLRRSIHSVP